MTRRATTLTGFAAVAAAVALTAGCSSDDPPPTETSAPTAPRATQTTVETPSETSTETTATETETATATPETTATSTENATAACDSASAAGLTDVAAHSAFNMRLHQPIQLGDVNCSGSHATARTIVPDGVQPTRVLFRFEAGRWHALEIGSAMDCGALGVPAADLSALAGCS